MAKYIDAEEITPIMAEYVADVFSRKEHLDDISYGYCMEIADVFRRYAERANQEQPEKKEGRVLPGFENEPKGIPGKDFVPVEWVETLERYGKWKIVKLEGDGSSEIPNDLEEAAEEHANKHYSEWDESWDDYNGHNVEPENDKLELMDAFIAGAKWMSIHGNDIKEL